MTSPNGPIKSSSVSTDTFDWGMIKWFITPDSTEGAKMTVGEVLLLPGKGHERHNHPEAEEILLVLTGEGEQMVGDQQPFPVRAGDLIYVPKAAYHSTINTGWEPMKLLAVYNPGGSEKDLTNLPDFRELAVGVLPVLRHDREEQAP